MLTPFDMPEAEDASDEKLLADIVEYSWHAVHIFAEGDAPGFAFTVGLYCQFEHPELLVFGLPQATAHAILTAAVAQIRAGTRIEPGQLYTELASLPFAASPIHLDGYREHLGYAMWFYGSLPAPFPALQLIWPDKAGLLPWQEGYDTRYFQLQPLLGSAL
jgi:hypothetical protein